ncbi:hypothetical protein EVAR_54571_1 [Eumeta japonica]|uniref:Uncharacterized protein n=1 Tax=Eumeta variegata TaxID=151549 RepID=A0A4C1YDV8_EUMVA|nr:hypothetical protein EVAR_54571_1 [Eumeta japonica]
MTMPGVVDSPPPMPGASHERNNCSLVLEVIISTTVLVSSPQPTLCWRAGVKVSPDPAVMREARCSGPQAAEGAETPYSKNKTSMTPFERRQDARFWIQFKYDECCHSQ